MTIELKEFSALETQMIRSSLATKTDDEIAELLERTVGEVRAKIDEITGGGSLARNERVVEVKEILRKQQVEKVNTRRNKEAAKEKRRIQAEQRNREKALTDRKDKLEAERKEAINHQVRKNRQDWERRQTVKTRVIDWSQMKTVKISKGTYVQVPRDVPDAEAIAKYHHNLENNGKWIKPGIGKGPSL